MASICNVPSTSPHDFCERTAPLVLAPALAKPPLRATIVFANPRLPVVEDDWVAVSRGYAVIKGTESRLCGQRICVHLGGGSLDYRGMACLEYQLPPLAAPKVGCLRY